MRPKFAVAAAAVLAAAGMAASIAVSDDPADTVVATACAHATVAAQTIAVNQAGVYTVPAVTDDRCETATATVPTVTQTVVQTVTAPTSTVVPTTTAPTTTVQPSGVNVVAGGAGCPAACPSFQAAFNAAPAGSTVTVQDGVYQAQTVSGSAKAVTFQAANPGGSKVASLTVNVDRVHFVGVVASGSGQTRGTLTVCDTGCTAAFTDVVFDGWHGRSAFIRQSGVTVIRSEFGGFDACQANAPEDGFRFWAGTGALAVPTNDALVDSEIHDIASGSQNTCQGTTHAGYHVDCVQMQGGNHILIQGDYFHGCPTSNMQIAPFGTGNVLANVTVAGNWLGSTGCCNNVVLGLNSGSASCSTLAVTGNVMFGGVNQNGCTGETVTGNTVCVSPVAPGCTPPSSPATSVARPTTP